MGKNRKPKNKKPAVTDENNNSVVCPEGETDVTESSRTDNDLRQEDSSLPVPEPCSEKLDGVLPSAVSSLPMKEDIAPVIKVSPASPERCAKAIEREPSSLNSSFEIVSEDPVTAITPAKPVTSSSVDQDDDWEWEDSGNLHKAQSEENERLRDQIDDIVSDLKDFLLNFADGKVREHINSELTNSKYSDFMDYYLENEKLAGYTINTELNRMNFRLRYQGAEITQKDEIIGVYEKTPFNDMWKLANQSIYSELLTVLQKVFVNPDLSISIISTSSSFDMDFDQNRISATSTFTFLTVQDMKFRPSKGSPSDRLQLASVQGRISIDMSKKRVSQKVEDPQIKMIFDDELRASAKCLLSFRSSVDSFDNEDGVGGLSITGRNAANLLNKAGETVMGSFGRLIGASEQREGDTSFRNGGDSKEIIGDDDIVSFDDFISDKVEASSPPRTPESSASGGGWFFKSAAEGFVGSIGKLLGADKREKDEGALKNLFVR